MSIEISRETEARLSDEARRHGISVDVLLERLMNECQAKARLALPGLQVLPMPARAEREGWTCCGAIPL